MNKPSPDKPRILTVQSWEWEKGLCSSLHRHRQFSLCVKLHSSLKEKVNICADLGAIQKNSKRIPKWDVNWTAHMPSIKSSPRLWDRGRGRMSRHLCWWAGAFQIQLLEQPACVVQVPKGVFSLESFVHRFLICVGFWEPMVQLFQALLIPRCFVRRLLPLYLSLGKI